MRHSIAAFFLSLSSLETHWPLRKLRLNLYFCFLFFLNLGIAIRAEKTSPSTGASKRNASKKEKELNTSLSTQHDEIVITPILGSSSPPLPAHSHFGGKKPKQHKPPKCISVLCKDEKEKLNTRLQDVKERELEGIKEELSKCELVMPFSIIKFWKIIEYTTLFPEAFFYFLLANFEALSA